MSSHRFGQPANFPPGGAKRIRAGVYHQMFVKVDVAARLSGSPLLDELHRHPVHALLEVFQQAG